MTGRVVLFGATGFTGRIAAAALVARGVPVVLAGRSAARLDEVRAGLEPGATTEVVVADATDEASVAGLVGRGDVLVTTVGPFARVGRAAARAAAAAGAAYLDSTGEAPFVRWAVEELDDAARATGAVLLPSFGYDYVPGQLAAALALDDAGAAAVAVRVGYFIEGSTFTRPQWSGGTLASAAGMISEPGFRWRDNRLQPDRPAARFTRMRAGDHTRDAVSVPSSEHLFLPRTFSRLRDVDVYLGVAGPLSRPLQIGALALSLATRVPLVTAVLRLAAARVLPGSTGGPTLQVRTRATTLAVAEALDGDGTTLVRVEVQGPSPYDLTGDLLAAAAARLSVGRRAVGVVGPVETFGVNGFADLCAGCGLVRTGA